MMNKKGVIPLFIIVSAVLLAGLLIIQQTGFQVGDITGQGGYLRPVFKYVKCESVGDLKFSASKEILSSGQWVSKPTSAELYNIDVKINKRSDFSSNSIIYSICNSKVLEKSNCRDGRFKVRVIVRREGEIIPINNIGINEYVAVQYTANGLSTGFKEKGITGAEYKLSFVPFGLREYDVLSGSSNPINPNDCSVPTDSDTWQDRFISTDSKKVNSKLSKISKNTNERVLKANEVRWYVSGYVTSEAESFVINYKSQEAWCRTTGTSAEIYKINKVKLASGEFKMVASPDWSDLLGTESCCPKSTRGDEVCNDKFSYEKIKGSECGAFKSCGSPNWVPYSEGEIIKYSCVEGTCKSETKEVECASNFDCKDSNQLCDLNKFKCVDANVNIKGEVIETIPDNTEDCEKKGGTWMTQQKSKKTGFLCFFGKGLCSEEIIVNEFCDLDNGFSFTKIAVFILIIILIIGILYFILPKFFPILRRFLPFI